MTDRSSIVSSLLLLPTSSQVELTQIETAFQDLANDYATLLKKYHYYLPHYGTDNPDDDSDGYYVPSIPPALSKDKEFMHYLDFAIEELERLILRNQQLFTHLQLCKIEFETDYVRNKNLKLSPLCSLQSSLPSSSSSSSTEEYITVLLRDMYDWRIQLLELNEKIIAFQQKLQDIQQHIQTIQKTTEDTTDNDNESTERNPLTNRSGTESLGTNTNNDDDEKDDGYNYHFPSSSSPDEEKILAFKGTNLRQRRQNQNHLTSNYQAKHNELTGTKVKSTKSSSLSTTFPSTITQRYPYPSGVPSPSSSSSSSSSTTAEDRITAVKNTFTMRNTNKQLQEELERLTAVKSLLSKDAETLMNLKYNQISLTGDITESATRVRTHKYREERNRLYIKIALYVFMAVAAYISLRRFSWFFLGIRLPGL